MRKYLVLAALASSVIAAPAAARDFIPYIGFDLGVVKPNSTKVDFSNGAVNADDSIRIRHKLGWEGDIFAGMDFGSFRLEAETAYRRANLKRTSIDAAPAAAVFTLPGTYDNDGSVKVASTMLNALFDFGMSDSFSASVGGGVGLAGVKYSNELSPGNALNFKSSDRAMAWQLLALVSMPISPAVDARVKYRYFQTGKLDFGRFCETSCGAIPDYELDSRFSSHSLLFGLAFNFLPPPPAPPPPPPPPPAPPPVVNQTCPDGSVIPASEMCPAPPPPPPPAPVERGERGD